MNINDITSLKLKFKHSELSANVNQATSIH